MPLRVLTANLLHVHADSGAFGRTLDEWVPDVVAVQELGSAVAGEIAARLPHTDLDPTDDAHGMGIASRLPVQFGRIALPHTDGWTAITGDGTVLASVHVRNPVDLPPGEANRQRRRQVEALLDWVADRSGPLVIAGDFNATPAWPAYRRIAVQLDDAVVMAAGRRASSMRTWGPRLLGGRKLLRIDHVFVRGFRAHEAQVIPISGSDHAAVLVDLEPTT